jgi:hypothetical protein
VLGEELHNRLGVLGAKLSTELLKALHELDDEVFQVCRVDRVSVVGLLAALLDVPLRYFAVSQPKKEVSHRPQGSTQNPALHMLIFGLYASIVQEAQGKLTLRKDVNDIRGTLPAVLEILRPYLPEVIPVMLPYETLRDIRKAARRLPPRIIPSVGQKAPEADDFRPFLDTRYPTAGGLNLPTECSKLSDTERSAH